MEALTRGARSVDSRFRLPGIRLRHAPLAGWWDLGSILRLRRMIVRAHRASRKGKGYGKAGEEAGEGGMEWKGGIVVHASRYRDALMAILARFLAGRARGGCAVAMTRHFASPARTGWLWRWLYRRLDLHIFVSETARQGWLDGWNDPGERERWAPLPSTRVVLNSLFPAGVPEPVAEREKGPVEALYHGRLAKGKGLERLIDAMAICVGRGHGFRLRILGNGDPDYVDSLRRRALKAGIMERIDWTRHTEDPYPAIASCHFEVLPSTEPEAFGMANLECMSQGRPQVCSANGAPAEYLTDGREALLIATHAFHLSPGLFAEALANAMIALATDPGLRRRMGAAAFRTYAAKLSWPAFAPTMEQLYREAMASRRKG